MNIDHDSSMHLERLHTTHFAWNSKDLSWKVFESSHRRSLEKRHHRTIFRDLLVSTGRCQQRPLRQLAREKADLNDWIRFFRSISISPDRQQRFLLLIFVWFDKNNSSSDADWSLIVSHGRLPHERNRRYLILMITRLTQIKARGNTALDELSHFLRR